MRLTYLLKAGNNNNNHLFLCVGANNLDLSGHLTSVYLLLKWYGR